MLSQWEQDLRRVIQKSETPFLGLIGDALAPQVRNAIDAAIASNPTIDNFNSLLYKFPALFAAHLTSEIMSGMGQSGNYDLYKHVLTAAKLSGYLSANDRFNLWCAFRSAVLHLGLEVSPRIAGHHYMADT